MKSNNRVLSQILFVWSWTRFGTFSTRYGGKLSNQEPLHDCVIDPILWRYVKGNKVLALGLNTDVKLFSRGELKVTIFPYIKFFINLTFNVKNVQGGGTDASLHL